MPELPEVETTVRGIRKRLIGKKIVDVWTSYDSSYYAKKREIKNPSYFKEFKKNIIGSKIIGSDRRAKNILIHLSNKETILVHMKMTGHLLYGTYEFDDSTNKKDPWHATKEGPLTDPFNRHVRLVLSFNDKTGLALSDIRRFAKVTLIPTKDLLSSEHTEHLGPEPLPEKFNLNAFIERLSKRPNAPIKSALMDQTLIAGIGNIYSDEILWRAGVHPESRFKNIPSKQISEMFKAMKETLNKGIDFGGDSMSDYRDIDGKKGKFQEQHQAYRRTKLPCRKRGCKGIIMRKVIGGRSSHFCSVHQKHY